MKPLRMAVVGVGALGRHHARILAGMDGVELKAVADTNPETGNRVAEACQTHWVADYRKLFERIDAVSIAVPTTFHLAVASEFLQRGIPVMVEKPLAPDVDQAEQLVELSEENKVLLQVGHVERFNPATTTAWPLCGPPKYIRAERVSPYAFRSTDIGAVHDLMIHDLDLVLDLVRSPVADVQAFGVSILGVHEDTVQARLQFENGGIADLTANRVCPFARRAMQIWSHTGCVSVDFQTRQVTSYSPTETLLYGTPVAERAAQSGANIEQLKRDVFEKFLRVTDHSVSDDDALTAELASFVDCVRTGAQPLVDGRTALNAMRVADRILQSVGKHQWDGQTDGAVGPFATRPQQHKRAG